MISPGLLFLERYNRRGRLTPGAEATLQAKIKTLPTTLADPRNLIGIHPRDLELVKAALALLPEARSPRQTSLIRRIAKRPMRKAAEGTVGPQPDAGGPGEGGFGLDEDMPALGDPRLYDLDEDMPGLGGERLYDLDEDMPGLDAAIGGPGPEAAGAAFEDLLPPQAPDEQTVGRPLEEVLTTLERRPQTAREVEARQIDDLDADAHAGAIPRQIQIMRPELLPEAAPPAAREVLDVLERRPAVAPRAPDVFDAPVLADDVAEAAAALPDFDVPLGPMPPGQIEEPSVAASFARIPAFKEDQEAGFVPGEQIPLTGSSSVDAVEYSEDPQDPHLLVTYRGGTTYKYPSPGGSTTWARDTAASILDRGGSAVWEYLRGSGGMPGYPATGNPRVFAGTGAGHATKYQIVGQGQYFGLGVEGPGKPRGVVPHAPAAPAPYPEPYRRSGGRGPSTWIHFPPFRQNLLEDLDWIRILEESGLPLRLNEKWGLLYHGLRDERIGKKIVKEGMDPTIIGGNTRWWVDSHSRDYIRDAVAPPHWAKIDGDWDSFSYGSGYKGGVLEDPDEKASEIMGTLLETLESRHGIPEKEVDFPKLKTTLEPMLRSQLGTSFVATSGYNAQGYGTTLLHRPFPVVGDTDLPDRPDVPWASDFEPSRDPDHPKIIDVLPSESYQLGIKTPTMGWNIADQDELEKHPRNSFRMRDVDDEIIKRQMKRDDPDWERIFRKNGLWQLGFHGTTLPKRAAIKEQGLRPTTGSTTASFTYNRLAESGATFDKQPSHYDFAAADDKPAYLRGIYETMRPPRREEFDDPDEYDEPVIQKTFAAKKDYLGKILRSQLDSAFIGMLPIASIGYGDWTEKGKPTPLLVRPFPVEAAGTQPAPKLRRGVDPELSPEDFVQPYPSWESAAALKKKTTGWGEMEHPEFYYDGKSSVIAAPMVIETADERIQSRLKEKNPDWSEFVEKKNSREDWDVPLTAKHFSMRAARINGILADPLEFVLEGNSFSKDALLRYPSGEERMCPQAISQLVGQEVPLGLTHAPTPDLPDHLQVGTYKVVGYDPDTGTDRAEIRINRAKLADVFSRLGKEDWVTPLLEKKLAPPLSSAYYCRVRDGIQYDFDFRSVSIVDRPNCGFPHCSAKVRS